MTPLERHFLLDGLWKNYIKSKKQRDLDIFYNVANETECLVKWPI